MTWVAHLARTMDGQLGAELVLSNEGGWATPINSIEEFDVTVSKEQLRTLETGWWKYFRTSVVVSWRGLDGKLHPWVAGPVVAPPEESQHKARLRCKGIGAVLEKRVVLDQDYGQPGTDFNDMSGLAKSTVTLTGRSLGTIAQDITKLCTDEKLGGFLPLRYASPRETGSGLNQRTYEGFNLANNGLWKRLTEISKVRGGPDFAFRPEWSADGRLQWAMYHGTYAQPAIDQDWTMDIDTTSSRSPVSDVNVTTDAANVTQRVYWTGAGEGAGTLVRMAQDVRALSDYMPLLETVGSTSDSDNAKLLSSHAKSALSAGRSHITQVTVVVDGADPRCEIGRWHVGDAAAVTLGDEWLTVPAGTTQKRIIAASGNWSSSVVDLEFQDDGPIEYEEDTTNG